GGFEAAYGLVQYLTGWQKIFTYTKIDYRSDATGTYINHNHYAGFIELALPLVVASVFYFFQLWSEARGKRAVPGIRGSAGIQSFRNYPRSGLSGGGRSARGVEERSPPGSRLSSDGYRPGDVRARLSPVSDDGTQLLL